MLVKFQITIKEICFFLLFFSYANLFSANIIFDMNGVLVKQSGAFWEIGATRFFGFFNPIRIEDSLFDFLDSIIPRRPETPRCMHKERLLSQIMCDFHAGFLSAREVRDLITRKLHELAPAIDSKRKVKLMQSIVDFIFTPERFAKVIMPLKKGVKILKKCYQQKDANGVRKHKIFIISNWDAESFSLLYDNKHIRKFLDLCDGIIISGKVGYLKPSPHIYTVAFDYFTINPDIEMTVIIDDEKCNIDAARSLNRRLLKCIHCNNLDFDYVRKTLQRLDIF